MPVNLKSSIRESLEDNKLQLARRLDAADAAKGRIPGQAPSKATVCVSFSMLPAEEALIPELQARAAREGRVVKNSEIARAALLLLATLRGTELAAALDKVERVRPGRKRQNQ